MADEENLRRYLRKATGELQRTIQRLREVEARDQDPIAIVGMGCRFPPDVRSPADLWQLVAAGGDGISPFPADRGWGAVSLLGPDDDMTPDAAACRGGFVAGAAEFDAGFFGIGQQEALAMDPQQRLLLETAWEAVEHAGLDPLSLRGTLTGLYAGVSYCNYAARLQATLPEAVEDHLVAGGAPSTTSGRVAYILGTHGPTITIDTACSSSLVAIHLACQGLRRGDCHLALAGGVTIMATPNAFTEFSRRGALAPDGRCKPFAAAADGMGFGEGVGLLVLERLSSAQRNGHPVLALVRGSAVNSDGATNGLSSPSRTAQEAVIRQALADARLTPDQVDAVEGHGTGTALGDSIEAEALIATYGEDRPAGRPLLLGSVKSNIGHTQAAAGVAGVIKMVMSIREGRLARMPNVDRASGYVDWPDGAVALLTQAVPWPDSDHPRRAGVSAFGISGTNAHLILEQPPAAAALAARGADSAAAAPAPWVLSAKTEQALRTMAAQLRDFAVAHPEAAVTDIGLSLARTRSGFKYRAVSTGATRGEHLAALTALAQGEPSPHLITGQATPQPKTAVALVGDEPSADDACRELAWLAEAYVAGSAVSWEAAFTGTGARQIQLPGYPFERERYWLATPVTLGRGAHAVVREPEHPLLGGAIDLADSAERWFTRTLTARQPWYIAQYRLRGTPALPPAAVAEWALAASPPGTGEHRAIEHLTFGGPVTFPGRLPVAVQAAVSARGELSEIRGFSADPVAPAPAWTLRFSARTARALPARCGDADLARLRSRMAEREPGSLFAQHSASGLDYGPSFRHVVGRWQGDAETLALIDADVAAPGDDPYVLHPVVLETCLLSAMPLIADRGGLWLPSSLARLSLYRGLPPRLWCHARLAGGGPVDLVLFSDSGEPLVTIDGLTFRAAGTDEFASRPATSAEPDVAGSWDADELSRLVLDQPEAARRVLLGILFERVTALLDVPPDDAESLREEFGRARLSELGLDSLRMMRLRDQLRALLCVDVPPQRLLGDATAADIVDLVCRFLATRNLVMTGDEQLDAAGQAEELVL